MVSWWRELLAERTEEAARIFGVIPGVQGVVLGGSVGRGEAWPMSDIDMLPICLPESLEAVARQQAALVDWWAGSGRAQALDVGWLAFTPDEVRAAVAGGVEAAVARMADRRWFHGIDKAFGGRGVADPEGLAADFARWATAVRLDPRVIAVRVAEWRRQVLAARNAALTAAAVGDAATATMRLRESARALRLVLIEGWGERLGSMGREWTRFERQAERHGAGALAARIAWLAGAEAVGIEAVAAQVPLWLRERIERSYAARLEVGEVITAAENARDQIAAYRIHVERHRPDWAGPWMAVPDVALGEKLAVLEGMIGEVG